MNIASLFKRKSNNQNEPLPVEVVSSDVKDNDNSAGTLSAVPANWIAVSDDGEFICSECGNKAAPETNTENGTVTADLAKVTSDLTQFPTKIIYGICPVCGMEFTFKLLEGSLYLEPSEMMK